ncbi:MAG: four-carbon acid sugar kinase family protein, partial [Lutimaribacter sp.]
MTTVLGCIADDFTGATDLAGLLARSGVPVSLRIGIPDAPPADPAPFEVIALKCRTAPAAAATSASPVAI